MFIALKSCGEFRRGRRVRARWTTVESGADRQIVKCWSQWQWPPVLSFSLLALFLNALGRIIETPQLDFLRKGVCLPFRCLENRLVEKQDYHNWPKEGDDGKNTFLVSRTSLLTTHLFSQKYTSGLYTKIPYPRNGPMDSGIGMSHMRSTNNILGEVIVPSHVNGDLTIALYRS